MHAARAPHVPQAAPEEYWEGSDTGMAAATLALTPLSVQQNIPNVQVMNHAPQTQVINELEQGEGRAPGWRMGWMKKVIPYAPEHIASHMQRNFGPLRAEQPLGYNVRKYLNKPDQRIETHIGKTPPVSLDPPHTVYSAAAAPTLSTWSEPL